MRKVAGENTGNGGRTAAKRPTAAVGACLSGRQVFISGKIEDLFFAAVGVFTNSKMGDQFFIFRQFPKPVKKNALQVSFLKLQL